MLVLAASIALAGVTPRAFAGLDDVLPTARGPALLVEGGLLRPGGRLQPTGAQRAVLGDELLTLGDDGLRWLDAEGHTLGRLPPGALADLREVDRVSGGLVFGEDGLSLGAVSEADLRMGGVGGDDDQPDLSDRRSIAPLHGPVVRGTSGGRLVLVQRADGVEVQGRGAAWGRVLPLWPELAGISPDGAAVVVLDPAGLSAWSVAGGQRLWTREGAGDATRLRVGLDFVGLGGEQGWVFVDPLSGHEIAKVSAQGLVVGADGAALGALGHVTGAALRGHPWAQPAPEPRAREDDLFRATQIRSPDGNVCSSPERWLALLERLPGLRTAWGSSLKRACDREMLRLRPLSEPPDVRRWRWMHGADLAWQAPGPILSGIAGPDGMVVLTGLDWTAALDRHGALRWWRDEALSLRFLAQGTLVTGAGGHLSALDPWTGALRWCLDLAVAGWLPPEGGWVLPVLGGSWRWLDLLRGRLLRRGPGHARPPALRYDRATTTREDLLEAGLGAEPPWQIAIGSGRTLVSVPNDEGQRGAAGWELRDARGEALRRWGWYHVVGSGGVVWSWGLDRVAAWYSGPPATTPASVYGADLRPPLDLSLPDPPPQAESWQQAPAAAPSGTSLTRHSPLLVWGPWRIYGVDPGSGALLWGASLRDRPSPDVVFVPESSLQVAGLQAQVMMPPKGERMLIVTGADGLAWRRPVHGDVWAMDPGEGEGAMILVRGRLGLVALDARDGSLRWALALQDGIVGLAGSP